jgi:CDP-diacylglycerol--glycerol-3-phosphate 3-phosphatidyltransferase
MRRDQGLARGVYRILERSVLPKILAHGGTPDSLTWLGLFISLVAGLAFLWSPIPAAILILVSGLLDILDGMVARHQGSAGPRGAFLDSVLDRYGEVFLYTGAWAYLYIHTPFRVWSVILAIGAVAGSLMVSYTRARGESLGVSCTDGIFQRAERLITLAVCGFLDPLAPGTLIMVALGVVTVGGNLTAIYRFWKIHAQLARRDDDRDAESKQAGPEQTTI